MTPRLMKRRIIQDLYTDLKIGKKRKERSKRKIKDTVGPLKEAT